MPSGRFLERTKKLHRFQPRKAPFHMAIPFGRYRACCPLRVAAILASAVLLPAAIASASPAPLTTDEMPTRFSARHARGEAEDDRVEALARFAAARTYQQHGDFTLALEHYARAFRYDPAATSASSAIVLLAVHQKRLPMAARYALKGVDADEVGAATLRRVAVYLTDQGDYLHAISFYEKALAAVDEDRDDVRNDVRNEAFEKIRNASGFKYVPKPRAKEKEEATDILLRLELGRLCHLAEKYPKAAVQFAHVIEALEHPERFGIDVEGKKVIFGDDPGLAYELFGEAFLLCDRYSDAESAYRKSHELAPNKTLLSYNLARIAARRGRAQEALAGLNAYFNDHLASEGPTPYLLLADVLKKLGKQNELLDRLQKLLVADPTNVPLGHFLAAEYLKAGQTDKAESLYLALMEKSPTSIALRDLAEIYRKSRQYTKQLGILGKIVAAYGTPEPPGFDAAHKLDAAELRGLIEAGRTKATVAPSKADFHECLALGMLAQERKQYETASEFFELALKANAAKASEVLLTWGIGSLLDDRSAEAAKIFQRGIDVHALPKDNPVFQFYLAGALAMCERGDEALAAAKEAAEKKPDSARFASRVPWILYRNKHNDEARKAYEAIVARFDGDVQSFETREILREARLTLSSLCVLVKRVPEAQEWLEQVLDECPDDVSASNDLGYLWADEGKHLQRARRMIVTAVAAEPENRAYRDSLGWVLFRLGRHADAVVELEKAIDPKQPDGTVLEHLGDACDKLGQRDRAVSAWKRAKDAFVKEKETDKVRAIEKKLSGT